MSHRLGAATWLDGDTFTAGDLLMVSVLRIIAGQGLVEAYGNLAAYMNRGVARPAFQRALTDQMAGFHGIAAARGPGLARPPAAIPDGLTQSKGGRR